MEAGRRADALVARRLWGVIVVHDTEAGDAFLVAGDRARLSLPHYTTSGDDAHLVATRMKDLGWTLHIQHMSSGRDPHWTCRFWRDDGREHPLLRSPTMALAIAAAAIEALDRT